MSVEKPKLNKISMLFLQKDNMPEDYARRDPEHKTIYRFIRTLFSAAQLTAECAIVTLVSLKTCQTLTIHCRLNNDYFLCSNPKIPGSYVN